MSGGALGRTPEALKARVRDVELSDGTTIRVEKWSWLKFKDMVGLVGAPGKALEIAEKSVPEKDVDRVRAMDPEDILAVAQGAIELNMTSAVLKNLSGLLQSGKGLLEAIEAGKAAEKRSS